jgi:hypothetical protein
MHIVRKDASGDIKWGEVFEVESLESYAKKRNRRINETLHTQRECFVVMSERLIERTDSSGRIIETYHLCQKTGGKLL